MWQLKNRIVYFTMCPEAATAAKCWTDFLRNLIGRKACHYFEAEFITESGNQKIELYVDTHEAENQFRQALVACGFVPGVNWTESNKTVHFEGAPEHYKE